MVPSIRCEICHEDLDSMSVQLRQTHYERHFASTEGSSSGATRSPPSSSIPKSRISTNFTPKKWPPKGKKVFRVNDVFWYPTKVEMPPLNYTPGLIPVLRRALLAGHSHGETRKGVLCYSEAVFIQREAWDAGWGCGYRNFLMACACLIVHPLQPMYFPLLEHPSPPSIRNLQQWIEDAWDRGFDPEGKLQLKRLIGTSKWIGASDLYVAFSSRGIPAELVDFTDARDVQVVIEWIVNYFTPPDTSPKVQRNAFEQLKGATPVICTEKLPLILQHAGHSRSIIGYEVGKHGDISLLAFDSGSCLPKDYRQLALVAASRNNKRVAENNVDNPRCKKQRSASPDIEIIAHSLPKKDPVKDDEDEIDITGFTSPHTKGKGPTASSSKSEPAFNYRSILRHFRLGSKKLGRNKQYQILYFPLTEPLSESEIRQRKIVTSTKIC